MCESIPAASIPPGHTPGIWKKCSNARPCGQFLLANAPPPVSSVVVKCPALQSIRSIYKVIGCHILINITVSAQSENCIKQVTKWVTSTEKRQSKWFYCFCRSFMVDKCSSTPKWLLETLDSERRRKWRQDVMKQSLLLFTNARRAGTLLTVKCPPPGTHRETNARGLPGGGVCSWLELTRT